MDISSAILLDKRQGFLSVDLYHFELFLRPKIANNDQFVFCKFDCHYKFVVSDEFDLGELEIFRVGSGHSFEVFKVTECAFKSPFAVDLFDDRVAGDTFYHSFCFSPLFLEVAQFIIRFSLLQSF